MVVVVVVAEMLLACLFAACSRTSLLPTETPLALAGSDRRKPWTNLYDGSVSVSVYSVWRGVLWYDVILAWFGSIESGPKTVESPSEYLQTDSDIPRGLLNRTAQHTQRICVWTIGVFFYTVIRDRSCTLHAWTLALATARAIHSQGQPSQTKTDEKEGLGFHVQGAIRQNALRPHRNTKYLVKQPKRCNHCLLHAAATFGNSPTTVVSRVDSASSA